MLLSIDDDDPRAIYLQIVAQVKEHIRSGELRPGDELPSVRELADSLGINLHTVHQAYQRLRDQGVVRLRLGRRARVAPLRREPASQETVQRVLGRQLRELITEAFHLGLSPGDFRELVNTLLDEPTEDGSRT